MIQDDDSWWVDSGATRGLQGQGVIQDL